MTRKLTILTIGIAALFAVVEAGAGDPVTHASLRAASEAAAADQSLVLLVFSAEWCGPCKQLKASTLSAPEFLQGAGVLHIADVDIDASPKLAGEFSVDAVPTLVLLTGDGKIAGRHTGYVPASELLAFINEGRDRAKAGQWEGTAPADKYAEYAKKAAADELTTNDLSRLVEMMGEADPGDRAAAAKILLAQREAVVPALIEAIHDPYLGVRLAAADLLQRLAPNASAVDPWQAPDEMTNSIAALRKWWSDTGQLPATAAPRQLDASAENFIKTQLEWVRGDDPVRRTEAMTALTGAGLAALPAVHEALRRAEKNSDPRALGYLEDVRWAILVSDAMEQRTGGVRRTLARGKSLERQEAAERLGRVGADALPVLGELASDSDSLVAESAVRALSSIGGGTAVPAIAALLGSSDSNLRMTAAQALGHSKSPDAIKPLLTASDDPNEVLACTAIGGLEEALSGDRWQAQTPTIPEGVAGGLRRCLADPRWRVRAAAAEAAGKLSITDLANDIKKLLADPDGFVVQSALTALEKLNAAPSTQELAALGRRLPTLRAATVKMMLAANTKETSDTVTGIYQGSAASEREAVLDALAELNINEQNPGDADWKPLFTAAIAAPEASLRRAAGRALVQQPVKLSSELVGRLLVDEDTETRASAAEVILKILEPTTPVVRTFGNAPVKGTNGLAIEPAPFAAWHAALLQHAGSKPTLRVAAAVYGTGDGKSDLPLLLAAMENPDPAGVRSRRGEDAATLQLILKKLPWPEGRPVIDRICASPALYALAAAKNEWAAPAAADYLMEPARFKAALEGASGDSLDTALGLLAGYGQEPEDAGQSGATGGAGKREPREWNLWGKDVRAHALALALLSSTNAAWRGAAVYELGLHTDWNTDNAIFDKAATDTNEWVRRSAVQALARRLKDRPALEAKIGPLLSDTNLGVASAAALSLIETEVLQSAGMSGQPAYFAFGSHYGGVMEYNFNNSEQRPLSVLEGKPAFLGAAKKWLTSAKDSDVVVFALLLAQYGQFDGLDRLATGTKEGAAREENEYEDVIMTGVALSQNAKYLPALRKIMVEQSDATQLRKILQALQGIHGAEARQLRIDINKKLRDASNQ